MSEENPQRVPGTRNAVLTGIVVGVVVFALLAGGIYAFQHADLRSKDAPPSTTPTHASSATPSPTPSGTKGPLPATDPRLRKFYDQQLHWTGCGANMCAWLQVPLDYADPGGRVVKLAVLKSPARDQNGKRGALVINPGGPGAPGTLYAAGGSLQYGEVLADHFDIVGFDPRGVGSSAPLTCGSTKQLDEQLAADPDPDTNAERLRLDRLTHAYGEACLRGDPGMARHMSTEEVARDVDVLRAALDEPKLDYLGSSYGTFIGATYADLFPRHVGRMVLDGAVDPQLTSLQSMLVQARGFEVALRAYVQDCVRQGNCFLGDTVTDGTKKIRSFLDDVEQHPLPTDTGTRLTGGWAFLGVLEPLYAKNRWPELTAGLQQAMAGKSGSKMLQLGYGYAHRGRSEYTDNLINALSNVNCLDHSDGVASADVPQLFPRFAKASPTFGRAFAYSLSFCKAWPVKTRKVSVALHAKGAPPIVVLGTTRDPATPLSWARGLARELDSGVLVTRDGDGHTAFRSGNSCIDNAVQGYLVSGQVPKNGLGC